MSEGCGPRLSVSKARFKSAQPNQTKPSSLAGWCAMGSPWAGHGLGLDAEFLPLTIWAMLSREDFHLWEGAQNTAEQSSKSTALRRLDNSLRCLFFRSFSLSLLKSSRFLSPRRNDACKLTPSTQLPSYVLPAWRKGPKTLKCVFEKCVNLQNRLNILFSYRAFPTAKCSRKDDLMFSF